MAPATHLNSSALAEVVRLRPFRRLWLVFGLSSLGDWLGLLATSSFASAQMGSPAAQGAAFGAVIAVQLLPSLLLGPVAGVLADRFDRRHTMVSVDVARFLLFASIPTAALLSHDHAIVVGWAAAASFTAQAAAMVWNPAKEAAVPNLIPRHRLETANQLTIITTYGITPVLAALAFAGAARLPSLGGTDAAAFALYFDALTFLASAAVVHFGVPEISGRGAPASARTESAGAALRTGWRYLTGTPMLRGLVIGLLGAFAGAGIVVGGARFYSRSLGGGDATFGLLFAALFVGFGAGVLAGPKLSAQVPRRLVFGLSVQLAGLAVVLLSVTVHLAAALAEVVVVGFGAGLAFLCGVTIIGGDVDDAVRGRVFAFVQTAARAMLLLAVASASALAGAGSPHRLILGPYSVRLADSRLLYAVAGLCGVTVGLVALRQMAGADIVSLYRAGRRELERRRVQHRAGSADRRTR
ncbi:MFS transporter [Actinoplanes sp. LDG1-06]|uniref:MFS transporter n=1 Tax=Paractinoplanes ovalisporus TaxID=2810368 RepID=A0ABS2A992_9ACTN|nr:MFS transporter [Actinoplanes ovalisporus]MBM2616406.1 MFS transporter [Actinoplanes ovalisporus]